MAWAQMTTVSPSYANSRAQHAAALIEAHVDGGLVVREGQIVYANAAATSLFNAASAQLHEAALAPLLGLDPEQVEPWLRERVGQSYEERLRRCTGEPFDARVGVSQLEGGHFGVSVQDVSEARAVADALETELVALEASRAAALASKQELIEALSLPMLRVWEGVIAVPLIGPLDGERAADALERLLEAVVGSSVRHVILDLTGLESVDASSAAALASMVRTLGLVGSRCMIAGINPKLAQLFVAEDFPLGDAMCFSTQAEALAAALRSMGWSVEHRAGGAASPRRSRA